jgi:hypothetical protein
MFGFVQLPGLFYITLAAIVTGYVFIAEFVKQIFYRSVYKTSDFPSPDKNHYYS